MTRHLRAACAIVFAAIGSTFTPPCAAQTPSHPPVEAFANLPFISDVSLSPDGKHLATIQTYEGRPVAVILDLEALGTVQPVVIPNSNGFIVKVQWANNQRLLITVNKNQRFHTQRVYGWLRTVSYDTKGENGVLLLNNIADLEVNVSGSSILDYDLDDPDHVYMEMYSTLSNGISLLGVYKVDVATGKGEKVMYGSSDTTDYIMDGHGNVVARIDQTKHPLEEHLLFYQGGTWFEVGKYNAEGDNGVGIMGLSQDGLSLLRSKQSGDAGIAGIASMSLSSRTETMLYSNPKFDVGGALVDPWTSRVVGYSVLTDEQEYHFIDPQLQALQNGLEQAFPGYNVHPVTWDLKMQKVILAVEGPRHPREYYILDRATHQAQWLASTYPDLTDADLGEVKPYLYKARDGLQIPAYLTLPPGKQPKNLPLVIMPHGGPMARDSMDFDYEAQFLANRGYAVLQPNFRGSSGYGSKFEEAGYGQWGLKMQDDVTDGVKKLIADGIADPKRICIYGGSYGGYAALAGAAFMPDLYACAASWAGVSDLRMFLRERRDEYGKDSAMIERWSKFIGNRSDDAEKLDAASPALHADMIRCPVLLMHGVKDSTVRIKQSEDMNSALEGARKKVTFIKIDDESHYMQNASTRIRVLTELEKFLAANIGN